MPDPDLVALDMVPLTSIQQAYFWKHTWQAGERESLADLEAGRVRVFGDPESAVRYLLSARE